MTTENARQRFKDAVGILVDEKGDIKQRLQVAYISQLSRINPQQDLPDHLREPFAEIKGPLTTDEVVGDRGNISKELRKISDDKASQFARGIFNIFLELHDLKESTP